MYIVAFMIYILFLFILHFLFYFSIEVLTKPLPYLSPFTCKLLVPILNDLFSGHTFPSLHHLCSFLDLQL